MENNAQTNETNVGAPETDYKELYEQTLKRAESAEAEAKKQKGLKDTYATENAEYKRQEADRKKQEVDSLPEVERLTKELEAERNAREAEKAEIARLKLEKEFSANGFSAEETAKLIDGNFAPKDIADIIKARVDEGVKSAKAEATKASTAGTLLGNGSTKTETSYAEKLAKQSFANGDELAKIKELYK